MKLLLAIALLVLVQYQTDGLRIHNKNFKGTAPKSVLPFKTQYITQFLDHFNSRDDRTFQQRYLINGKIRILKLNFILHV